MTDEIEDLWPDLNPTGIVTPAAILKTQAVVLSQKSKGVLLGEVETWSTSQGIHHRLLLVVPALDNYRYELLSVHHSITVYPVYVDSSPVPFTPGESKGIDGFLARRMIQDEERFREWLKEVFGATETRRILDNLLAQASS